MGEAKRQCEISLKDVAGKGLRCSSVLTPYGSAYVRPLPRLSPAQLARTLSKRQTDPNWNRAIAGCRLTVVDYVPRRRKSSFPDL